MRDIALGELALQPGARLKPKCAYLPRPRVLDLWADSVRRCPGALAVRAEDRVVTFEQLDDMSNRLAKTLREKGVGPEVRVGVHAGRSIELVLGILSVWKAGGAYVPLDPGSRPSASHTCSPTAKRGSCSARSR